MAQFAAAPAFRQPFGRLSSYQSCWRAAFDSFALVWQLPLQDDTTMGQPIVKSTYAEPTVMWRLQNSDDGRRAYAVIVPQGWQATAGWFSQGIPQECREFPTWHGAIRWVEAKLVTLQLHGWHLDEPPNGRRANARPRKKR